MAAVDEGKGSVEDAIASLENDDFSDVIGKKRRYYTPNEVSMHNIAEDCWVSIFGKVYDLSPFLSANEGPLAQPIINFAGQDISSWFDKATGGVKHELDETTGLRLPYLPHGRFIHVAPPEPVSDWKTDFGTPWWKDESFCIGNLSTRTRNIRIVNTLTSQEKTLEVCSEETLDEILDRYMDWNSHAGSYTWKTLAGSEFRPL